MLVAAKTKSVLLVNAGLIDVAARRRRSMLAATHRSPFVLDVRRIRSVDRASAGTTVAVTRKLRSSTDATSIEGGDKKLFRA